MNTLNVNQFDMSVMLAQATNLTNPNVIAVRTNPSSAQVSFPSGTAVKLIAGQSDERLVDACTGPTDPSFLGVIVYNSRKATTAPGDRRDVFAPGSTLYLEAAGAIPRGSFLSYVAPTYSGSTQLTDPQVQVATTGQTVIGQAYDQANGANAMLQVTIVYPFVSP
jgi:hypothetical protein